jgi:hypothetical protein
MHHFFFDVLWAARERSVCSTGSGNSTAVSSPNGGPAEALTVILVEKTRPKGARVSGKGKS